MAKGLPGTEVTVPLAYLDNARTAYVRRDVLEDEDTLAAMMKSIKKIGLILPLLVMSDYQVVDGAIRLEALRRLGRTDIPIIQASNWDVTKAYYMEVLRLSKEGAAPKRMWWLDQADLIERFLKPIYEPVRKAQLAPRYTYTKPGEPKVRAPRYGRIYHDLEQMFETSLNKLVILRDLRSTISSASDGGGPDFAKKVEAQVEQMQAENEKIYAALAVARQAVRSLEIKAAPPGRSNLATAREQLEALERFVLVLSTLNQQAQMLRPISPHMPAEDAARLGVAIKTATKYITPLGTALRDHASKAQERENQK